MSDAPRAYRGREVTVTFDSKVCIHAGNCVRELPLVFDLKARPWVRPDAASRRDVVAQVDRCPSGALRIVGGDDSGSYQTGS